MLAAGYFLRIANELWVEQVFNTLVYYTSVHRKWTAGQTVVFIHKTVRGDAIVGYGVLGEVYEKDELPPVEKNECTKRGWEKALSFGYMMRFENPLPVKETFLRDQKFRGRFCHGLQLNRDQLSQIIRQAELLQTPTHQKS